MNASLDLTARALQSLRDIDGVYGSFLIDADGETRARDLPSVFDDQTLAESGARIAQLWEVICDGGAPDHVLLEFAEYNLFLRRVGTGCLCVVVPTQVNVLALRLACKGVARYFEPVAHRNTFIS